MRRLPEMDDGVAVPPYTHMACARRASQQFSQDDCVPPSEMTCHAHGFLKLTRTALGEALEAAEQFEEALPLYHALVEQAKQMRQDIWQDNSELHLYMNSLALCYKRAGQIPEAIKWYQATLQKMEEEGGSPHRGTVEHNLKCLVENNEEEDISNFQSIDPVHADAVNDMEALANAPLFEQILAQAMRCGMEGDMDRKMELIHQAIAVSPEDPRGHYNLAVQYMRAEEYENATVSFMRAMKCVDIEQHRGMEELWARSAANVFLCFDHSLVDSLPKPDWMCHAQKMMQAGLRAAKGAPDFNEAWNMLGSAIEEGPNPAAAIKCFDQAAQVSETEMNRRKYFIKARELEQRLS
eukprot:Sro1802_g298570.1 n/a (352) ;mRNA; r:13364-14419